MLNRKIRRLRQPPFILILTTTMITVYSLYGYNATKKEYFQKIHSGLTDTKKTKSAEQVHVNHTAYHQNNSSTTLKTGDLSSIPFVNRQTNVAFLKVHKTGSTTIMNIFLRFADSNGLNIVLPNISNYLGYDRTINMKNILPAPKNETYNILCNHVVYNKRVFYQVMPPDTVFTAIVRNPETHIISASRYYGVLRILQDKLGRMPSQTLLSQFLKYPRILNNVEQKFINNRMSLDFGIPRKDLTSREEILRHLDRLDRDFVLVMVNEWFDESLVLLKRYLCWTLKDIIYSPLNALKSDEQIVIKDDDLENLKKYNMADFVLYEYFKLRLFKRIEEEGDDFSDEVRNFKKTVAQVQKYCKRKPRNLKGIMIAPTKWNDEFIFSNNDCDFILTKEAIPLINSFKKKHLRKLYG